MKSILSYRGFNFEFLCVLGMAPVHGAEVDESWSGAAEVAGAAGEEALQASDKETARCAFLRASSYRRAIVPLEIPYEGHTLPWYLYLPQPGSTIVGGKVPVLINTDGFDSVQEELYFFNAAGARAQGYATLTFYGPDQGIVLRRDKLSIRPDWEVVISAVIDQLDAVAKAHPEWNLDLVKVALTGAAMGGYFALRGALDSRVKACISTDGFYDFEAAACKLQFQLAFELGHAKLAFGTMSVCEALRRLASLTLEPKGEKTVCGRITYPTLVMEARHSNTRWRRLEDGKTKEFWTPMTPGQGSLQSKASAITHFNAKTFTWLDGVFGITREALAQ
ncbi:alpha/beta hydrolase [Xylariaceae sp. FL1272]|nr:alpha/beta hydrolase [Xylariaceae sp. FL1272]